LLRRKLNRTDEADRVMEAMVRANDGDFRAYLARGHYWTEAGAPEKAAKDLGRARELAPDDPEVLLAAAAAALARGRKASLGGSRCWTSSTPASWRAAGAGGRPPAPPSAPAPASGIGPTCPSGATCCRGSAASGWGTWTAVTRPTTGPPRPTRTARPPASAWAP